MSPFIAYTENAVLVTYASENRYVEVSRSGESYLLQHKLLSDDVPIKTENIEDLSEEFQPELLSQVQNFFK